VLSLDPLPSVLLERLQHLVAPIQMGLHPVECLNRHRLTANTHARVQRPLITHLCEQNSLFGQAERSLGSKSSAFPPPFDIFEMNGPLPEAQKEMRILACVAWESFVHSLANN
jgi:hypothetical protein